METKELTLFEGSFESTPVTMSSREIASLTEKEHRHVLRDCDKLNESYESFGLPKIWQSTYKAGNGHTYREYRLTRMQYFDLMTGYSRELRIKVNRRWEKLKKKECTQPPTSYADALRKLAAVVEQNEQQQKRLDKTFDSNYGEVNLYHRRVFEMYENGRKWKQLH